MKIFVISLRDAAARRQRISSQLNNLGIDYEFIDAVDGRLGLPQDYKDLIDPIRTVAEIGREMSDAEYACAFSHQKAYREIVNRHLEGAIILEDDAIVRPALKEVLAGKFLEKFQIIQLDSSVTRVYRFGGFGKVGSFRAWRVYLNSERTTGYFVSQSGANYLLNNSLPICRPADWPCDVTKIDMHVLIPRVIGHDDLDSYINYGRDLMRLSGIKFIKKRLNIFEKLLTKKV